MPTDGASLEDYWRELQGQLPIHHYPDGSRKPCGMVGDDDPDFLAFQEALQDTTSSKSGAFHIRLFEGLAQYGRVPSFVIDFRGDRNSGEIPQQRQTLPTIPPVAPTRRPVVGFTISRPVDSSETRLEVSDERVEKVTVFDALGELLDD